METLYPYSSSFCLLVPSNITRRSPAGASSRADRGATVGNGDESSNLQPAQWQALTCAGGVQGGPPGRTPHPNSIDNSHERIDTEQPRLRTYTHAYRHGDART
eukprot:GHVU01163565.1.p6 GENE.GHVU01163565.1~~GHVU01163565.1.p6  ORF type:complete len:103 (+),score=3.96 GHVU01163565.1:473-781(+)